MNKLLLLALPLVIAMPALAAPESQARIGQTVSLGAVSVRPLAIVEDSRCPPETTCIIEGWLVVRVEVGTERGKRRMDLTLDKPVRIAGGTLLLADSTPISGNDSSAYRLTFRFKGKR